MSMDITDNDALTMLLLRSLPAHIKAGNEKHLSNIRAYPTVVALKKCKFINFNSKSQISMMIFDIDEFNGKTALEHFKNIRCFLEYIVERIGFEPTYVLETQKGFHFGYHLKNHVFMHQSKAVAFLQSVKRAISEVLCCDPIASHRLNGVWRNPLLHISYFSEQSNYELSDFKFLLQDKKRNRRNTSVKVTIDNTQLTEGNRNIYLFQSAMRYAKGFSSLTEKDIFLFLEQSNQKCEKPLASQELMSISRSVFIYWTKDAIKFGETFHKDINEGIMGFTKMADLSFEEYQAETKRRQRLSALRTNEIKNQNNLPVRMDEAREKSAINRQKRSKDKIHKAIEFLANEGEKITITSISQFARINRRTVMKYL